MKYGYPIFLPDALIEFVRLVREVPDGMQLVPIEPTEAMLEVFGFECQSRKFAYEVGRDLWKAMLEAAKEQS